MLPAIGACCVVVGAVRLYPLPVTAVLTPRPSLEEIDEVEPTMVRIIYCRVDGGRWFCDLLWVTVFFPLIVMNKIHETA